MKEKMELPVPVLEHPHWRVNFRPQEYQERLIPSLGKCYEVIEKNKLSLRGWDYPHLSVRQTERTQGNNWVASWSDFDAYEYWRLYQSGQFVHLFSVREAIDTDWKEKLKSALRSRIADNQGINWQEVPGFISIVNLVYNVTEIYEFAARLCQSQIYVGTVNITIEIKGIRGFMLAAEERLIFRHYEAGEDVLARLDNRESEQLIANSKDAAIETVMYFFERFGWINPQESMISTEQDRLLKGRY